MVAKKPHKKPIVHMAGIAICLIATTLCAQSKPSSQAQSAFAQAESAYEQGRILAKHNKYREAIQYFSLAIKLYPDKPWYYFDRGSALFHCEDAAPAMADLDKAIALDPAQAEFYFQKARIHQLVGEDQLALKSFDRAIKLAGGKSRWDWYEGRGHCNRSIGDFSKAIVDYTKQIQIKPGDRMGYVNQASHLPQAGKISGSYRRSVQGDRAEKSG